MALHLMLAAVQAAASLAQSVPATAAQSADVPSVRVVTAPALPGIILPKGTMVRLMVLKEVNSRDHVAGHRFVLRVDEEIEVGGMTLIPIGAKGWGEVVASERTGSVGKSGRINARLLFVETNGQRIVLSGERQSAGGGGTGQTVASVLAFGPFGLLMKGNNASLKAGEILNGYTVDDAVFDRAPRTATP